ncbi:MAG: TolC family protein [Allomuricauda sp.]|jgi:outer membrane protein TolC|uniref:TolC family protein n=1 Tax=Flagellimonas sp. MMG031 TaxID=3158549 RepID=A0AAU7MZH9_9FLAO|nr:MULTISPECIES: TolC family protein [unclassified Allomuricauda]MBO6588194.1 TolC family protein [Allomuricauda sp.]MBO6617819.1 TolC family protein [Allomuricauda sp.]MBO6643170.1 TolC family protein [Allomuricauda sp.]MBO6746154.1 TolC family protein [Allomuricauda sp.]MBO6842856.1 TolC family protein [Allomuricauda sp.]
MRQTLITLLFILPWLASAQDSIPSFSLDQAITYALEHNYTAQNAERDILDAQKQKWETIASGLPQINGAVSYQNQLKQPVAQIPAEFFGGEPGTFQEVVFGQPQSIAATATLTQQIFDGSYIVGVQATKTFLDYSQNNKEKTELDVRKSVVEAYGNVLLAQESVLISEKNKATLEENLYETKRIYENGLGDEESVDQLQITLSSVENQLKNARRMEKITRQMLNLVLGLPIEAPTVLTENLDDLTQKQIDLGLIDSEFDIENNVDFKMAANLNEQRFLELKLAKSRALPTLNAFVNYGGNSFSDRFNFFSSGQQWFGSSILGVDLNIPIFSSLQRSASTQRAKIALEKAKTQFTETQSRIRLQLETAKSDYILAIEQYGTSKDNLDLAERIEKKNQIKYSEGLATSFELRQAQTQLYNSQQEYLQSMVDVINKKTALENIINQ